MLCDCTIGPCEEAMSQIPVKLLISCHPNTPKKHMKTTSIALGIALFATPLLAGVQTQTVADKKVIIPTEAPSRLAISAGYMARQIDADFYTNPKASDFGVDSSMVEMIDSRLGIDLLNIDTHFGDRNTVGAPYIKADYRVLGGNQTSFNVFGQYSFVFDSDHSTGRMNKTISEGSNFRPEVLGASFSPKYTTTTRSNLDISLHELALGFELQQQLVNRVHLSLGVGPTFNLFDFDYNSKTSIFENGYSAPKSLKVNDGGQAFRMGVVGQVGLKVDLDSKSRYFVEVFGRYNWVDTLNIGNSSSHVKVNASSFSGGVGLGINL